MSPSGTGPFNFIWRKDGVLLSGQTTNSITIPLVLFGLYRYWYLVEAHDGGESPTDVILTDWPMGIVVLLWIGACVAALWP